MNDVGILVVDDDRAILQVIERMLSHFKVKVDCVMSATEALDRLKTKDYRTMITDLDMPGINGFELARRARKQFPDLNIVLFTGNTTEQIINLALDPKVSDISEVHRKPSGLGEMLRGIIKRETGRTFLLE
ncbi:response regulator [Geobacter pelophilus]|uniref:Response regulator n=1 Tax=Geoanaerobacter pelophilus TaxID=60036 RepID=A0AAW4L4S9_9BACT|nr:response regulator [Geoanaerobacter pelophilus]MBT0663054.1 response regulator [Geoanaerobacter pelophilus]